MGITISIVVAVAIAAWLVNDFRATLVPGVLAVVAAALAFITYENNGEDPRLYGSIVALMAGAVLMTVVLIVIAVRRWFSNRKRSWIER
jgi:ABC-type phosphate transport system permease subunit